MPRHLPLAAVAALALVAGCPAANTGNPPETTVRQGTPRPAATKTAAASTKPTPTPTPTPRASTSPTASPTASPTGSPSATTSPSGSPSASPSASTSPSASPTSAPTTAAVSITGMAFVPAAIRIKKGGTITFTNNDSMSHNVTPDGNSGFTASPTIAPGGGTAAITFNTEGTFAYLCTFHTTMKGSVEVVP